MRRTLARWIMAVDKDPLMLAITFIWGAMCYMLYTDNGWRGVLVTNGVLLLFIGVSWSCVKLLELAVAWAKRQS